MDLADLLCNEEVTEICEDIGRMDYSLEVCSQVDSVLLEDSRVLSNLLREERSSPKTDYCATLQTQIKPHMRKIVVDWMLEVCEDQQCPASVFHQAVSYLDRYLTRVNLPKNCFQAVAAGCLLLASKFVEVRPITTEQLSLYTDHSASVAELREWELKILHILEWQLCDVTPQSFLDQFLGQSTAALAGSSKVRRHAEVLAATAMTEYKFLNVRPSLMAAAALSAACRGLSLQYQLPTALAAEAGSVATLEAHLESLVAAYTTQYNVIPTAASTAKAATAACPVAREGGTTTPTDCHQVAALVGGA